MSDIKRYDLRIVSRYSADGEGDIETDAQMRPSERGEWVKFADVPAWRPYIPGENQPELNVEVFVRFSREWPLYRNYFVTAAALCGTDDLRWYDGRWEEMQGLVSHWMPMISAGLPE